MGQDRGGISISCLNWLILRQPLWPWLEAHLAFFKDRSEEIAKGKMQSADSMAPGSLLLAPADLHCRDYLPTDKSGRLGQGAEVRKSQTWLSLR